MGGVEFSKISCKEKIIDKYIFTSEIYIYLRVKYGMGGIAFT